MALLTQFVSFFISLFGEKSVTDELNSFLKSHRIINVEKRLIGSTLVTGTKFPRQSSLGEILFKNEFYGKMIYEM
jgi:hypothetical protein